MNTRKANILLWIAQILLAATFAMAGAMKFIMSDAQLRANGPLPVPLIHFVGVFETLGVFGMILPGITHIKTFLTPLAAAGMCVVLVAAIIVTAMTMPNRAMLILPSVTLILAIFVAYGRTRIAPLRDRDEVAAATRR